MAKQQPRLPKRSSKYGIGKEIGGAVYVHRDYRDIFPETSEAEALLPEEFEFHVVKKTLASDRISFVAVPGFDREEEPAIGEIYSVSNGQLKRRKALADPYIYHHKWMFVRDDYAGFDVAAAKERSLSWMKLEDVDKRRIGRKSYWEKTVVPRLANNPRVEPNAISKDLESKLNSNSVARHKTAIRRPSYSRPIKCLLRDGLLGESIEFFDYGCGHGRDLDLLQDLGIRCSGWDPNFQPNAELLEADVVNLGYVINVIEDADERADAVRKAWALATKVLSVAAQLEIAAPEKDQQGYADGFLTSRGTFQKYYNQHGLREYLEQLTGEDAIPAAPGVFYVFKDESTKQQFIANRFRRRQTVPRRRISEVLYEQHKELLEHFLKTLTSLGRLPGPEEFDRPDELIETFGSLKRAFALIRRVTDEEPWDEIAQKRAEDLLVYLALSAFGQRPRLSQLPSSIQRDVKSFLGGYKIACGRADTLLFRAGDPDAIDQACTRSRIGHLVENALIVHRSALDRLEPLLRIYEGCARALVGDIEEATLIKLHRFSGKVSYLSYPDFERSAHPALQVRIKVSLRTLSIDYFDYTDWDDPLILLGKDRFLSDDYPSIEKFRKLTTQEEKHGLLTNKGEGVRNSTWEAALRENGFSVNGHRLRRDK